MYNLLKNYGIPIYLVRDSDITLNQTKRVNKIKSLCGSLDNILLISNHINAGGGTGAEIIYALRNNNKLANLILNNLDKNGFKIRKSYQKSLVTNKNKDYYYILRDTSSAEALIIEYGFIDSDKDLYNLINKQDEMVKIVVESIIDYLGLNVGTYKVKSGDSLYKIANMYHTSVDKLKDMNNLKSNTIFINQLLMVPNVYTVKSGDTLSYIAKKFNTSVDKIKKYNNLKSDLIKINQQLIV